LTDLQRKRLAQARVGNKRAKAIVRNMIVNALSTKNTVAIDPSAYSLSEGKITPFCSFFALWFEY